MIQASYVRNTVHEQLELIGETGYLLKSTTDVNPITGRSETTTSKVAAIMAYGKINSKEMYGVDFNFNDRRCYISAKDLNLAGVTPDLDDKIIVAGKTWRITWVHDYRVSGTAVMWMCKVSA